MNKTAESAAVGERLNELGVAYRCAYPSCYVDIMHPQSGERIEYGIHEPVEGSLKDSRGETYESVEAIAEWYHRKTEETCEMDHNAAMAKPDAARSDAERWKPQHNQTDRPRIVHVTPLELLGMVQHHPTDQETLRLVQQQHDRTGFAGIRADIVHELSAYLGNVHIS